MRTPVDQSCPGALEGARKPIFQRATSALSSATAGCGIKHRGGRDVGLQAGAEKVCRTRRYRRRRIAVEPQAAMGETDTAAA